MNINTNEMIELKKQVQEQVEETLKEAKKILYAIDSEIDKLEGNDIHKAMLKVQEHLMDWNALGSSFVYYGIQTWIEPEGDG